MIISGEGYITMTMQDQVCAEVHCRETFSYNESLLRFPGTRLYQSNCGRMMNVASSSPPTHETMWAQPDIHGVSEKDHVAHFLLF